jgi:hypothetical protein
MEETYKPERRFRASLTIYNLWGYQDVEMYLYKDDIENNTDTIDFSKAIKDYDPADKERYYPESAVKEMFTLDEILIMKEYFNRWGDVHIFHYSEASFPIKENTIGTRYVAVGGNNDRYMFSEDEGYPLNFSICGFYSITGCKKI